jgi:8-oxo-dGTP diphosphatase
MMSPLRHSDFTNAILIDTIGRFLFQQRDNIPGIFQPGKIGLFGGHRESDETYLQCIVREVHEEISYFLPPERFGYLTSYDGIDVDVEGSRALHGKIFVARGVPVEKLVITEGRLFVAEPDEIASLTPLLSPSAKTGLKAFLESPTRSVRSTPRSRVRK